MILLSPLAVFLNIVVEIKYKADPTAIILEALKQLSIVLRCEGDKALTVHSLQAFWGLALCLFSALMTSLTRPQSCWLPCHFGHAKHVCAYRLNPFSHV